MLGRLGFLAVFAFVICVSAASSVRADWVGAYYVHTVQWDKDGKTVFFKVGPQDGATDVEHPFLTESASVEASRGFADLLTQAMIHNKPIQVYVSGERLNADGCTWRIVSGIQILRSEASKAVSQSANEPAKQ